MKKYHTLNFVYCIIITSVLYMYISFHDPNPFSKLNSFKNRAVEKYCVQILWKIREISINVYYNKYSSLYFLKERIFHVTFRSLCVIYSTNSLSLSSLPFHLMIWEIFRNWHTHAPRKHNPTWNICLIFSRGEECKIFKKL